MWDLIVPVPDHCLCFYSGIFISCVIFLHPKDLLFRTYLISSHEHNAGSRMFSGEASSHE